MPKINAKIAGGGGGEDEIFSPSPGRSRYRVRPGQRSVSWAVYLALISLLPTRSQFLDRCIGRYTDSIVP